MTKKLDIHNAAISVTVEEFTSPDDRGRIPENLAKATFTLLGLHKANGDLAWVADIARDMECAEYGLDHEMTKEVEEAFNPRGIYPAPAQVEVHNG